MKRSTQSFKDVRKFNYLRSNEESGETNNGCNAERNGVSRGSTSIAWWWGICGGLVDWVGWWWNNSGGVDWWGNWGISWDISDDGVAGGTRAVGRGDSGCIAVVLSGADGGVVGVGVCWGLNWVLSRSSWVLNGSRVLNWGISWVGFWNIDGSAVDWGNIVTLTVAGGDGVVGRGVCGSWAVGHICGARSDGDLLVAGIGNLGTILSWSGVDSLGGWNGVNSFAGWGTVWGSGGWGSIDGLAGWGTVGILGASLDGGVDLAGGGVVDRLFVVDASERTRDGGGGSEKGSEMHFG